MEEHAPPPRKNYTPYNETPLRKKDPMNQKLVKIAVKAGLGLAVSALIGATVKCETRAQDSIDAFFAAKAK
jgi:hypothetical protein